MQSTEQAVTFYTVVDEIFFPGFVALYNSVRLMGHVAPFVVLDLGMNDDQRSILDSIDVETVRGFGESEFALHHKPFASRLDTTGVIVVIDSDMIVTGSLRTMIDKAREGKICLFPDPDDSRWFTEWKTLFGLSVTPRKQTYYNTGVVAFSVDTWPDLLGRWWDLLVRIQERPTFQQGADMRTDPTSQGDQDALNAILMTEVPEDAVESLPSTGEVFRRDMMQVLVENSRTLTCTFRGGNPIILHCSSSPKPWAANAWKGGHPVYPFIELMRRLLVSDDVALRVPDSMLVPWLRSGLAGALALRYLIAADKTRRLSKRVGRALKRRLVR